MRDMDPEAGKYLDVVVGDSGRDDGASQARPWIGVLFECCGVYLRIFREPRIDRYEGRCPSCGRQVVVRVGSDGTSSRVFRATLR